MTFSSVLIVLLMAGILAVLVAGVFLMGRGGEANRRYGNRLMFARVWLQGLVLVVLLLLFFMSGK